MRTVTPKGNRIISRPGAAAFSDSTDDRLFVFSNQRLSILEPDAKSSVFIDVSDSLAWSRKLAGTDDANPIIGLVAHPSGDLIAAAQDGLLIRFDWRTAGILWSRRVPGIGKIRSMRRSPAGDFLALIGENGIRMLRTNDGLLASGVLLPPYIFDPGFDLSRCLESYKSTPTFIDALTDVTLGERGVLIAQCGSARFSWQLKAYAGNTLSRIDELLGDKP
jgi:hypothetical protein